jgi:hypothetical protein
LPELRSVAQLKGMKNAVIPADVDGAIANYHRPTGSWRAYSIIGRALPDLAAIAGAPGG